MKKGEDYIGVTVGFFCHDGMGNVFMAKRGKNCRDEIGTWDTGGGALEFGETVEQCLKKEILEEYGTDCLSFEFMGFRDVFRENNGKKTHWLALDFKALIDKKKAKNNEPNKFDEVGWFSKDNLPKPLHSGLMRALEKNGMKLWNK